MDHFDRFLTASIKTSNPILVAKAKEKKIKYRELEYKTFDSEGKRYWDITWACITIEMAYKDLKRALNYIQTPSGRPKGVKYEEHIRYHYEYFLQTSYTLQEKLKLIWPQINQVGGNWVDRDASKIHRNLCQQINKIFSPVAGRRKVIVHRHYPFVDRDFYTPEILSHVRDLDNTKDWEEAYKGHCIDLKFWKIYELRDQIKQYEKIIEGLFEQLCDKFIKDEKLVLP